MLEIVICDDEKALRNDLFKIVEQELDLCGEEFRIREFECGEDLIREFDAKPCDILFLDIEMKELNGMEAAKILRKKHAACQIIFITSYPDFVFQGYEVSALNYILKPYKTEKIRSILQTALQRLQIETECYFILEQKSGSFKLPLSQVKYFLSEKRQIHAVTTSQSYTFYGKLNDIEAKLPDSFIRIHNRYLVNLKYIQAIDGNQVLLKQEVLPVSRSCKQTLSIAFAKYMLG